MTSAARRIRLMFFILGVLGLIERKGNTIIVKKIIVFYESCRKGDNSFFRSSQRGREPSRNGQEKTNSSAAAHAISAVQAFVARAAADRDMAAGVACRGVALHAAGSRVNGVQAVFSSGGGDSRRFGGFSGTIDRVAGGGGMGAVARGAIGAAVGGAMGAAAGFGDNPHIAQLGRRLIVGLGTVVIPVILPCIGYFRPVEHVYEISPAEIFVGE